MARTTNISISVDFPQLTALAASIEALTTQQEHMMSVLDELRSTVAVDTEVTSSAITLLEGLAQKLEEAGTDEAALAEIRDELNANSQALAEAVSANTPADTGGGTPPEG